MASNANNNAQMLGRIANKPFETVGRQESWAEQRTANVTVVGKFADLDGKVKPGDSMANHAGWFDGKFSDNWYVKTIDLVSPDGITGELRLSIIKCPNGKTQPYNITWDISMEEVQMRLINNPSIQKEGSIDVLVKWLDTPVGQRVSKDNKTGKVKYYYYDYDENGDFKARNEVKKKWDIAFCNAVTAGIESYNKYLPVITKNSYYLELPGAQYDGDHVITGGSINQFTGPDAIGHLDTPPMSITGYTTQNGIWFKNCDKFTSQPDGTWVRTEGWVYTNDATHKWIYSGELK